MATEFIAKAVTPEGLIFRKPVTFLKIRTENGDIGILANHINFISPLGAGEILIRETDNKETSYYIFSQDYYLILSYFQKSSRYVVGSFLIIFFSYKHFTCTKRRYEINMVCQYSNISILCSYL